MEVPITPVTQDGQVVVGVDYGSPAPDGSVVVVIEDPSVLGRLHQLRIEHGVVSELRIVSEPTVPELP